VNTNELADPHIFAPIATIAAFRYGEQWRKQMLAYVEDNIRFVEKYCADIFPESVLCVLKPVSWCGSIAVRGLGLSHEQLLDLFVDKAHLALNDGEMFGPGGEGIHASECGMSEEYYQKEDWTSCRGQ
jgi:cystathionine beta-lyase